MVNFNGINLGNHGEKLHRYTMFCRDGYCKEIEYKINNFLSQNSSRNIDILNITQYGINDGAYTTIWFVYKDE